jgi:hypothetical protein
LERPALKANAIIGQGFELLTDISFLNNKIDGNSGEVREWTRCSGGIHI